MKRGIGICILFFFLTSVPFAQNWIRLMQDSNASFYDIQKAFNKYWDGKKIEKGKGWKQFKRWENFMEPRVYPGGEMNHAADLWKAYRELKKNEPLNKSAKTAGWTSMGPVDIPLNGGGAGRINCIAFTPGNPSIMFAGSPSGGLWKSTDAGNSWSTNTDLLPNIGVSGIAINPVNTDIMYIATGDGDAGDTYSVGVLKSIDGGQTWDTTGLSFTVSQTRTIRKLLIHPVNTDTLFAATNVGIYRSTDAGQSWIKVRTGNFYDIEFKPGDPSVIWGSTTSRIFKSSDSGNTFQVCTAFTPSNTGRLAIAVTADDPDYLYILGGNNIDNGFAGVWKTADLGTTFTLCADNPNMLGWSTDGSDSGGQAWYDLAIAVSPVSKNVIYIGGVNIWRSSDGGTSWSLNTHWYGGGGKPYVHADVHAIEFVTGSGTGIYVGCDGGVFKTTNSGSTWSDKSATLSIAQMYRLGCSATDAGLVMTGWQDNGTNLYDNSSWSNVIGGDGMECMIDYSSSNYMYGELYYGDIYRSDDGGNSWNAITNNITEDGDWITPYMQDPQNPQTIYAGYDNLWRSDDRGDSWTKLSDFTGTNKITVLAVAPSNSNIIYICRSGFVQKSIDGGIIFTSVSTGLPSLTITSIAVSPDDPEVLWVTLSGYYAGSKVYASRNGGITWVNYSGSLPNIPANTIVMETATDEGLYLGTDLGVFYRDSTMNDWVTFNTGMPNVIIDELEIHYSSGKLRAATYGRGLWETDLFSSWGTGNEISPAENTIDVFPNPSDGSVSIYLPALEDGTNAELMIINSMGAVVHSEKIKSASGSGIYVDMNNKPQGLYVIKVRTAQHIFSGSFIKI